MDRSKQAFPTSKRKTENYMDAGGYGRTRTVTVEEGGMTLREYYAGLVMQGLISTYKGGGAWTIEGAEHLADQCILLTDALIARLEEDK